MERVSAETFEHGIIKDGAVVYRGHAPGKKVPGCAMCATRPTADLGEDGELVKRLRDDDDLSARMEAADRLILYREALERIAEWPLPLPRSVDDSVSQRESVRDVARAVLSRSGH